MKKSIGLLLALVLLWPELAAAQTPAGEMQSLRRVLDSLYEEMMPLCNQLIGVGRGLAGFAALWYIAARVWRHIANAEPVDLYPLLRPFVIGGAILLFPSVLGLMNGVLRPTVTATEGMVKNSDRAIAVLLQKKEKAIQQSPNWQMYVGETGSGDRDRWYRYTHPDGADEGVLDGVGNDIKFAMAKASYNFRNAIKQWMSEVLHLLYESAALCIQTIRTFYLVVLAILGPLVFGLSVFDGFAHTLTVWLARYVNVFLWLPVANLFGGIIGKIQENMLRVDIDQIGQSGDTFFSTTDTAYLLFLIIGIVGYLTVPSVAGYIVHASGANALLHKATHLFTGTGTSFVGNAVQGAGDLSGAAAHGLGRLSGSSPSASDRTSTHSGAGSATGDYQRDRLSGQ
jgi:conjugative transposon TraJ protein